MEKLESVFNPYFREWGRDYPDDAHRFDSACAAIAKARGGKA